MKKWLESPACRARITCLLLFLGTLLLFSRAVRHDFLDLDDPDYVTQNLHVQSGPTRTGVRWAFTTDTAGNWHPLTWLSHMLDWRLFGHNPHGHHATNVLLHALNAVFAFLALRKLTGAFWMSALSAALFAWHPLRVESVAWIAERKDVFSVFFGLMTIWAYAVYAEKRRENSGGIWGFYTLALMTFATGLLCKPMLVTLPFVLLLLDFWPLRRFNGLTIRRLLAEKIPFFLFAAVSCVLTYLAQKKGGAVVETLAFHLRLENAVVSVAAYLGKFFWPFNLSVGYPRPADWPMATVAGATFLLLAITAVAGWQWRQRPWLIVGWLWFLGMLVPIIGLVQVGLQAMADRYTYLPVLGLQLALLWALLEMNLFSRVRWLMLAAAVAMLGSCAARTWDQLAVWRNSRTLYEHALAVTRDNYLAHCYLGTALLNEARLEDSRRHFQRAIEIKPDYDAARFRLGLVLEKLDRENEALAVYEEFLKLKPDDPQAQFHCANVLARLNRDEESLPHYARAIQLKPDFAEAQCNYADSLRALNHLTEACVHYRRALTGQATNANAYYGLGAALEDLGRTDEALASYRRAVECRPTFAAAQYNLGVLLFNRNQPAEAVTHLQAAVQIQANNAAAYVALGFAEAQLDQTPEAVRDLERAQQLDPNISGVPETLMALREKLAAGRTGKP